jgi:hypothetical protein
LFLRMFSFSRHNLMALSSTRMLSLGRNGPSKGRQPAAPRIESIQREADFMFLSTGASLPGAGLRSTGNRRKFCRAEVLQRRPRQEQGLRDSDR